MKSSQLGSRPAREKADKLNQNQTRGGLGRTRKHPQWCRDLVTLLFLRTDLTLSEIANYFPEVPEGTIKTWSLAIPVPAHRAGVQGSRPIDVVAALEKENSDLKTQLETLKMQVEAFELTPQSTDNLLARARMQLKLVMAVAKPGELAAIMASLQKIKLAEEVMRAENERAKRFGTTPKWFEEWVRSNSGPIVRPPMDEHSRGIIPDESEEDTGDLDPSADEDTNPSEEGADKND